MSQRVFGRALFVFGLIAAIAIIVDRSSQAAPPAKGSKAAQAEEADRPPRLPAHYAAVVTEEQRAKITAIQKEFAPQIRQKREELKAVTDKQEAAINKLLSAKQLKEIEKLRAESRAKRASAGGADEEDEEMPESKSKSAKSK